VTRPRKKLDAQATAKLLFADFQFLESLLPFRRGWGANQALQRTRRERRGCNRCVPCAGSLSLGR
jgi:hypothetical protein